MLEAERLLHREGQLEIVRTKELLERYLPQSPARLMDIGGGTGVYAEWLASKGHEVHLVDVVESHVVAAARAGTFTTSVGDARELAAEDRSYDVTLLLGPMYHLLFRDERLKALKEASRVTRSGGLMATAYISRLAVALDGFVKGWIYGERGRDAIEQAVRLGTDHGGSGFGPIGYFHLPSEIRPELEEADREVIEVFGVEGPGWIDADFDARWQRPDQREAILDSARICESSPEVQGLSSHILAIARKG